MAITDENYLHVHKGNSSYILLRGHSHFHLIRVDASLTESKMAKLLRKYPCESDQLQKMGIHFSAFKAENLRGVLVKGYDVGDQLELWIGGDSRIFQLGTDYSAEQISSFFSGFQLFTRLPPKWEGLDPTLIWVTTIMVNALSIACATFFYFVYNPYWFWSVACLLCQFTAIILPTIFPESFILMDGDSKTKNSLHIGKGNLLAALIAPGFALTLRSITDFTFDNTALGWTLLLSSVMYLVLFFPLIRISRHTKHRVIVSLSIVIIMIFLGMGTIEQLNYLLDYNGGASQIVEVIDKRASRSTKSTTFYCEVILPNGERQEYTTAGKIYRDIAIGEQVLVTHYSGAFRIPFSILSTLPDT